MVLYGIYANDGYHKCLIQVCEIIRFELRFVRMNLVMIEGRRPCITLVSDNLYIVQEIVSMDVDVR